PILAAANVTFQRRVSPMASRAQALRAEVSGVAHESFDGALVVKTLGREDTETERFTHAAHRLRDALIQVGRMRSMFDPFMEALPNLGVLAVLLIRRHMPMRSTASTPRLGRASRSAACAPCSTRSWKPCPTSVYSQYSSSACGACPPEPSTQVTW